MKPSIALLSLLCLGLAAALLVRYSSGTETAAQRAAMEQRLISYSNQVEETRVKLDEQNRLSGYLQSNLTARSAELAAASNQIAAAATKLADVETQVRTAQGESQKLSARLAQVEGERDGLQTRLNDLASQIKSLNGQIAETQRKLAAAEGDRDFLTKELARLQTDKAELVRQFNDVAVVRAQLALLREEAAVNQRLSWMSQGVYQRSGMKGAQALVSKPSPLLATDRPSLEVEVYQEGTKPAAPAAK